MRIAPLSDVKARLSAYVEECEADGPIVITRSGRAVAVLLTPMDDDDLERLILAHSQRFHHLLDRSRRSLAAGKGLSTKEFWGASASRQERQSRATPTRHKVIARE